MLSCHPAWTGQRFWVSQRVNTNSFPERGFLVSWELVSYDKTWHLDTGIFSSKGWTELCVRQVGSDSAWPRVHVSKSSHAALSLHLKQNHWLWRVLIRPSMSTDNSLPDSIPSFLRGPQAAGMRSRASNIPATNISAGLLLGPFALKEEILRFLAVCFTSGRILFSRRALHEKMELWFNLPSSSNFIFSSLTVESVNKS